jgi:hypothetical protein
VRCADTPEKFIGRPGGSGLESVWKKVYSKGVSFCME